MKNSDSKIGGFCTILFVVFLVLKLAGVGSVATWSWWWVTSPLWLPVAGVLGFIVLMCLMAFIGFLVSLLFTLKRK